MIPGLLKPLLAIPVLLAGVPLLRWLFRDTWRELDGEAHRHRKERLAEGVSDRRPLVGLVICAAALTFIRFYGMRPTYAGIVRPILAEWDSAHGGSLRLLRYDELWGWAWWTGIRVLGYLAPLGVWKLYFPKDSILDFGFRAKGGFRELWICGLLLAAVVPAVLLASREPDFRMVYPLYRASSRSWFDLLLWEGLYFLQFFALEAFFRGFGIGVLRRSFGSGAIFAMAVPYCMIHFDKPYFEAMGAILTAIVLGSLCARTRSIYPGFLMHITVAGLMDGLALLQRNALPTSFWPP